MTDENLQEAEVETEQEGEQKTDAPQAKSSDKKFTDSDMAALRRKLSKEHSDKETAWNTERGTLQGTIDTQNETIKEMVDLLKKDVEFDPDYLELLEEKSPADQLKILLKKAEKVQDIPRTPQGKGQLPKQLPFKRTNTV
jgi:hypothetical protein